MKNMCAVPRGSSQTKQETRQHVVMVIVVVSDGGGGSYTVLYLLFPFLNFSSLEKAFFNFFSSFCVCLFLLEDWEFPWAGSKEIGMGY